MGITHFRVYATCGNCSAPASRDHSTRKPAEFAERMQIGGDVQLLPSKCSRCGAGGYFEVNWQAITHVQIGYSADVEIQFSTGDHKFDPSAVGNGRLRLRDKFDAAASLLPAGTRGVLDVIVDGRHDCCVVEVERIERNRGSLWPEGISEACGLPPDGPEDTITVYYRKVADSP